MSSMHCNNVFSLICRSTVHWIHWIQEQIWEQTIQSWLSYLPNRCEADLRLVCSDRSSLKRFPCPLDPCWHVFFLLTEPITRCCNKGLSRPPPPCHPLSTFPWGDKFTNLMIHWPLRNVLGVHKRYHLFIISSQKIQGLLSSVELRLWISILLRCLWEELSWY